MNEFLGEMNKKLPAKVYLPFKKEHYHHRTVLNILIEECKVFTTKERTPICISLEIAKAKAESRTHHKAKRVKSLVEDDCSNIRRSQLFEQDESVNNLDDYQTEDDHIMEEELVPNTFMEGMSKLVDKAK